MYENVKYTLINAHKVTQYYNLSSYFLASMVRKKKQQRFYEN